MSAGYDAVCVGNALVDALVRIDDDALLLELGLNRGEMHPVDHDTWHRAYERVQTQGVEVQSGGSGANTIATLGLLGARVNFCGQVGQDQMGHLYAARIQEAAGRHALRFTEAHATGKCLSIISPGDAERTMLTDLGAAVNLGGLGDFADAIRSSRLLHVEGYLLLGEPMRSRAREAVAIAREAGVTVSLDAADPFVVRAVREVMWEFVQRSDIVFLNMEEAGALVEDQPEVALSQLGGIVRTVVVKLGSRGSLVKHEGVLYPALAYPTKAIDTTGAGDAYAAGYLYGHLHGWSPQRSAELAARVAALTVSQMGAVVRDADKLRGAIAQVGGAA